MWLGLLGLFGKLPGISKLSSKLQEILLICAIVAGALLLIRWYSNSKYESGKYDGRIEMSEELIKQKEEEWAAREQQIADKKEAQELEFAAERAKISSQLAEISRQRGETRSALNRFVDTIRTERDRENANVYSIPASELDDAIRDLSNKLAASQ